MTPPFNNHRVRRAVLMAVDQSDVLRSVVGHDSSLYQVCHSIFPCGTPYETQDSDGWMKQDLAAAQAELRASGYKGEKVVLMNPTDQPTIHPMGVVIDSLLRRLGMTVDLQE